MLEASCSETNRVDEVELPSPKQLNESRRLDSGAEARIARGREEICAIHEARDDRLLVVVGPCSIHDADGAVEYGALLAASAQRLADELVIVMRVYCEKPRTRLGWKGYACDPTLDGKNDLREGLIRSHDLLARLSELGVLCGSELLNPLFAPYVTGLLAWACLGARTAESQTHRELMSGLELPVGVKNPLDGRIESALDAMIAIHSPQSFLAVDAFGRICARHTRGNRSAHLVLRGAVHGPNYDADTVAMYAARIEAELGPRRPIVIDCSHGNSRKDHTRQPHVFKDVLAQLEQGGRSIAGLMLESHLDAGRQELVPGRAVSTRRSITDACLGWPETELLLNEAAETVRRCRRARRARTANA